MRFIRVRFGSFGRFPAVVGFLWVRLDHSGAPRGSLGSFTFIWARPKGRRIHSGSFSSFGCSPGVVGFIRARLVHYVEPRGSLSTFRRTTGFGGFIVVRLVYSREPLWTSGSLRFVWFILALPSGSRVRSGRVQ